LSHHSDAIWEKKGKKFHRIRDQIFKKIVVKNDGFNSFE
jgi:hypothetical protein